MKRIIAVLLTIISLGLLSGCKWGRADIPEYESGNYVYIVKANKDGTKEAYITGFTETGAEQEVLVYPKELDGIPVYGLGYDRQKLVGDNIVGNLKSEKLKKMFFPVLPKCETRSEALDGLYEITYGIYWNLEDDNPNLRVRGFKGSIYGYNLIAEKHRIWSQEISIANVSYMYNFGDAPNMGYYWVDNYDESCITFYPPEPERDGYTFDGWYKDSECIEPWDFNTDKTGEDIVVKKTHLDEYEAYNGTYLYAKWTKI